MARKLQQPVARPAISSAVKPVPSAPKIAQPAVAKPVIKPAPIATQVTPVAPLVKKADTPAPVPLPVSEVPKPAETKIEAQKAPEVEGTPLMATVAPERAQTAFGDFNDRAKTAFEKSAKIGEEMTEFAKGNVEAVVASARIAAKGAEAMAQEAAEYSKKHLESATSAFKSYASVKSPTEFFQLHNEHVKSSFDAMVAEASKLSESFTKLAGEVAQPISNRYAIALEKIKSTAL